MLQSGTRDVSQASNIWQTHCLHCAAITSSPWAWKICNTFTSEANSNSQSVRCPSSHRLQYTIAETLTSKSNLKHLRCNSGKTLTPGITWRNPGLRKTSHASISISLLNFRWGLVRLRYKCFNWLTYAQITTTQQNGPRYTYIKCKVRNYTQKLALLLQHY